MLKRVKTSTRRLVSLALAATLVVALQPLGAAGQKAAPKLFEHIDNLDRFGADARAVLGEGYVPHWPAECPEEGSENFCPPNNFTFSSIQGFHGTIIVIPHVRQLWQFYPGPGQQPDGVLVRDLDSLEITKVLHLPALDQSGGSPGDWGNAIDEVHDRIFLLQGDHAAIVEVDLKTFRVKIRPLPGAGGGLAAYPNGTAVGGMSYDPFQDDLLILRGGVPYTSAAHVNTFLYQMDLGSEQNRVADAAKVYRIQSCTGPITSIDAGGTTALWEVLVAEDYLWIPCQRAGHIGIVVRMKRPAPDNPAPTEDYIAGPNYATMALADQQARRIFMTSSQGEIWAFDADTLSFLGVVATTDVQPVQGVNPGSGETGWGLDPSTGRFYFQTDWSGLGMVDGRFFPVPQALIDRTRKRSAVQRIYADAGTNRIFVLEGVWGFEKPRHYKIYRVLPAPEPPPPPNPDLNTADIEEKAGVTESRFFSKASGYGFRAIWAGGWEKVIPAPPLGVLCWTCPINQGLGGGDRKGSVDREYYLGRVISAEYDTGSTSASAIGTGADQVSRQQFNLKWGNAASCSSETGGKSETAKGTPADMGPSTVKCPVPGGELRAYGEGSVHGSVSVGKAWTETIITKLNRGVLSQTTAVAQDITIAEFIHIGEVRSMATSLSNGRPSRKDMSTHSVAIKGVRIGDDLVCSECTDNEALVRLLTTAGGPLRMQFRVGTQNVSGLDLALLRGTPGGALTAVQKSEARQAQDRVLVGDTSTDVPGLEMTVFNDNVQWGRARQIYQFAGVSSVATYNIVPLPKGEPLDEEDSLLPLGEDLTGESPVLSLTEGDSSDGSAGDRIGGAIQRAIQAIGRGLRLFLSNPRQFLLLLTAWALFGLAPYLSRRRRLLDLARAA